VSRKFLETATYDLLEKEQYFAAFLAESRICYDKYGVTTAGASVVNGSPMLIFNTEFMGKLSRLEVVSVVKHEILHMLLLHTSMLDQKELNAKVWNLAMDCAINQHIVGLPEVAVTLKGMSELCGAQLLPFETAEYYFEQMKAAAEDGRGGMRLVNGSADPGDASSGVIDNHDLDVPGSETNKEMAKAAIKSASDKALARAAGNIPSGLDKILGGLSTAAIDWKTVLRNFVARSAKSSTNITKKKLHRRFGLDQPGRKKRRELTLGVCIDCSGSVPDEAIVQFYAEIAAMLPNISEAWIVQADCEVQHVEKATKSSKIDVKRKGAGGTAYAPAIAECMRRKCDAVAYLGDMDTADTPTNPGVPVLWVTTGNMKRPGEFGHVVSIAVGSNGI
jgi:predicted metal-dependent peptidase